MNQRTWFYLNQWFGSTIHQVNNSFFFLFPFLSEKKNNLLHTHTYIQNNRSIYLFGMFSKQSHSIATFIYNRTGQSRGKKVNTQKSCTTFVIDDEENNHVNLAFCTLSLLCYLISISWHINRIKGQGKGERMKK